MHGDFAKASKTVKKIPTKNYWLFGNKATIVRIKDGYTKKYF